MNGWTREKPTKPGWYWYWADDSRSPVVAVVREYFNKLWVRICDDDDDWGYSLSQYGGLWAPCVPPPLPEDKSDA